MESMYIAIVVKIKLVFMYKVLVDSSLKCGSIPMSIILWWTI